MRGHRRIRLGRRPQSVSITREGWLYLGVLAFILAGAMLRQINLLMMLFGLLASPMLLNWRFVKTTLRKIEVLRKLPASISAGDMLMVELIATNGRRRLPSWVVTASDRITHQGGSRRHPLFEPAVLFTFLRPGQSLAVSYRGRLAQRGRYAFGPIELSTGFPLGLLRGRVTIEDDATLVVLPRLGRLGPAWRRLEQSADLGQGHMARQQGFLEGEFYGLRDWRPGDSRRWVHWRTSARRQTIVVRQFEQQRTLELVVIADLWQPASPTRDELDNVELAVSFAATIVSDWCRRGGRWLAMAITPRQDWFTEGPTSMALLHEMVSGLALADATTQDMLPGVLAATFARIRPGARVVVVSTRPVDFSDTRRFALLASSSSMRAWLHKIHVIDVARADLSDYFVPEA